jgi:hypothetical protein
LSTLTALSSDSSEFRALYAVASAGEKYTESWTLAPAGVDEQPFLDKKSQVGKPPIMAPLFEPGKPEAGRIEKQQYYNPNRIDRPKREAVVRGKEFARAPHRWWRKQQE